MLCYISHYDICYHTVCKCWHNLCYITESFVLPVEDQIKHANTDWLHSRGFLCYLLLWSLNTVIPVAQTSQCVLQTGCQMGPSHPSLSLYHWLLSSAHLFVFHIVTAVNCKSDSFPAMFYPLMLFALAWQDIYKVINQSLEVSLWTSLFSASICGPHSAAAASQR